MIIIIIQLVTISEYYVLCNDIIVNPACPMINVHVYRWVFYYF